MGTGSKAWGYIASHLAGRPVEMLFEQPAVKSAYGTTSRKGEIPVIHIAPNIPTIDVWFKVCLHEIAHAKLHYKTIKPSDTHALPSNSIDDNGYTQRQMAEEHEANAQVFTWLAYAEAKRDPTQPLYEGLLKALMRYPDV